MGAVLSEIDPGTAGVIIAVITTIGGIILAFVNSSKKEARIAGTKAEAAVARAELVGKQIGQANGHGDLHTAISSIYSMIEEDRYHREEGQRRQLAILSAQAELRELITGLADSVQRNTAWIDRHSEDDLRSFSELKKSLEAVQTLLGTPDPDMDPTPLIQYVHELRHTVVGAEGKLRMIGNLSMSQVIEMLEESRNLVDEIRAERKLMWREAALPNPPVEPSVEPPDPPESS